MRISLGTSSARIMSMVRTTLAVSNAVPFWSSFTSSANSFSTLAASAPSIRTSLPRTTIVVPRKRGFDGAKDLVVLPDERDHQVVARHEVSGGWGHWLREAYAVEESRQ